MWSLIVAIVIGFIAGLIARAIHPGDDKAGFIVTTLLGIAGSLVATYGGRLLGLYSEGSAAGFIASVIGAIVILFIYNMVTKKNLNSAIKKKHRFRCFFYASLNSYKPSSRHIFSMVVEGTAPFTLKPFEKITTGVPCKPRLRPSSMLRSIGLAHGFFDVG